MTDDTPKSTTLLLVRHAVTEETGKVLSGRTPGIDLSEEGRAQAKATAERLAGAPVAAVYSSPIERTWQTAEIVAAPHGLDVIRLDGMIEAEYGGWTGKALDELAKTDLWKTVQVAPSRARFPDGGESIREMQARAAAALDAVVAAHAGDVVVVVSHSDVIKAVAAWYLGLHLDLFQRISISPASVTAFLFGPYAPMLLTLNDAGVLDGLNPSAPPPEAT